MSAFILEMAYFSPRHMAIPSPSFFPGKSSISIQSLLKFLTMLAVPSGELSSTTKVAQRYSRFWLATSSSWASKMEILSRSLKVGIRLMTRGFINVYDTGMSGKHRLNIVRGLVVAGMCLLSSFMTIKGEVDPDFFSQYYVGRGMVAGKLMYGNFTDNKGPVLYLFFAGLDLVFGDNYGLALGAGSFVLNSLLIWGVVSLVDEVVERKRIKLVSEVAFLGVMILYLLWSFAWGGIFAEGVGMTFLVWAAIYSKRKRNLVSGMLFAGAVLSRQTLGLFLPYLVYLSYYNGGEIKKNLGRFILGAGLVGMVALGGLAVTHDLGNFVHNSISVALNYVATTNRLRWPYVIYRLYDSGFYRPILGVVLIEIACTWEFLKRKKRRGEIMILLVCSAAATFSGGVMYTHHFLQLALIFGVAFGILVFEFKYKYVRAGVMLVMAIAVIDWQVKYFLQLDRGNFLTLDYKPAGVPQIEQKKYLMVVSYHPKLYFDYDKQSPDKYFMPFFISTFFNSKAESEQMLHAENMRSKLGETAFVFIKSDTFNSKMADDYLDVFEKRFSLVKVGEQQLPGATMEIYWSEEK